MPSRADPEEQRSIIIAAASRCFARKGYHRTTMDEIVTESGLSKGTLYWYFESKQKLFLAMIDSWVDLMMAQMHYVADDAHQPAADRLRRLGEVATEGIAAQPDLVTLMIEGWMALRGDESAHQWLLEMYTPFLDVIASVIDDGIQRGEFRPVNARELAAALGAALDGIALQVLVEMPGDFRERVAILIEVVLDGLSVGRINAA